MFGAVQRVAITASLILAMGRMGGVEVASTGLNILRHAHKYDEDEDATATVLAQVTKKFHGSPGGQCEILLFLDNKTVSLRSYSKFIIELQAPVTVIDASLLKFGLSTAKSGNKRLPLADLLLSRQEDKRCRILLSWSVPQYQRSLQILAKFEPGLIKIDDRMIFFTDDKTFEQFLPELQRKTFVRKLPARFKGQSRNVSEFIIETVCDTYPEFQVKIIGTWRQNTKLQWRDDVIKAKDLSGRQLRVTYTESVPNIFNIENNTLDGLEFRMLEYAAKALNFTYTLQKPPDGQWGSYINGSWTGKVGDIVYNRADIAVGGIVYRSDRANVVSYSDFFQRELWGIVCPAPRQLPQWPYIVLPFRSRTSSYILTFIVFTHAAVIFIFIFVSSINRKRRVQRLRPFARSLQRVFAAAAAVYFRLMICLYFWNLYYSITKPLFQHPINSVNQLFKSNKNWGIVQGTTVESVLENSMDSLVNKVVRSSQNLSSISEGMSNLETRGTCIVGVPKRFAQSVITTRYTTQCGENALHISQQNLQTVPGGWLMTLNSPLKKLLDDILIRLQRFGFLDKWSSDLYGVMSTRREDKLPCIKIPQGPLDLADLRIAFYVLVGGFGLSIVLFIFEHFIVFSIKCINIKVVICCSNSNDLENQPHRRSRRRPQIAWSEKLLRQIAPNREINRIPTANEALLRHRMSQLLKSVVSYPSTSVEEPQVEEIRDEGDARSLQSASSSTSSYDFPTQMSSVNQTRTVTPQIVSALVHNGTFSRTSSSMSRIANGVHGRLLYVQPYVARLAQASRVLPWSSRRGSGRVASTFSRQQQIPDSPIPRARHFADANRRLIRLETMNQIEESCEDITDISRVSTGTDQRKRFEMAKMIKNMLMQLKNGSSSEHEDNFINRNYRGSLRDSCDKTEEKASKSDSNE